LEMKGRRKEGGIKRSMMEGRTNTTTGNGCRFGKPVVGVEKRGKRWSEWRNMRRRDST